MQVWSLATLSFILGDWIGTNLELGCCICVCISLVYSLTPYEEKQNPHSLGQLHSSVSPDIYFPFWNIHFHLLIAGFNGKERSSPAFHWALSSQRSLLKTWCNLFSHMCLLYMEQISMHWCDPRASVPRAPIGSPCLCKYVPFPPHTLNWDTADGVLLMLT